MVPLIETERLILRSFAESDLDAQAAVMGDERIVPHLGGNVFSREETWRRMLCAPGLWMMLGYGYWAVERRSDGALLGQVGFADFKRAMHPSIENLPEMGWIFAVEAQGHGYASEAVSAGLGWADAQLPGREIVAIIAPDNAPSIRLARRSGFETQQETVYKDEPILLFRRAPAAGRQANTSVAQ